MIKLFQNISILVFIFILASCNSKDESNSLFSILNSDKTGIGFENTLSLTEEFNPYTFKSFYNGGGVALGDVNNDDLIDVFFSGNQVDNKLYINRGNLNFEDVTNGSKLACSGAWSSGATFVDINHDGYLDVYICKSGDPKTPHRNNQMFINNGNLTFVDKSKEYGLDFIGLSIHSAFFDYDLDGDLDCYLLNNSIRSIGAYDIVENLREINQENGGNKLLKNLESETGEIKFIDVSKEAGIYTSAIGFGLGVSVSDLNDDGWPDLFVSNDFFERDYLYINLKDGTFKETIVASTDELSMGSMGADIADLNNDGLPEIFVTEMLPEQMDRYKSKVEFESYDKSQLNFSKGYHRQFARNALHYHAGVTGDTPIFKELSRKHKMEATDWSWGALLADFDNNGLRDVFVANGIKRDLLDQDQIKFYSPDKIGERIKQNQNNAIRSIIEEFPSTPLHNYLFLQDSLNNFRKVSGILNDAGFSNGSAYADLDNDGDLDIVTNNVDQRAFIYKNNTEDRRYLKINLIGDKLNRNAIGAKINLYSDSIHLVAEQNPMRGYQSCVSNIIHFGLGRIESIDSLVIRWPDLSYTALDNIVEIDTLYEVVYNDVQKYNRKRKLGKEVGTILLKEENLIKYKHAQSRFKDFDKNRIQNFFISNTGPVVSIADFNGDERDDILIGGEKGESSYLFSQKQNGKFTKEDVFLETKNSKTQGFLVKDFDNDGSVDCLILNGGFGFATESQDLKDKLYLNKGGRFSLSNLNAAYMNSMCGISYDLDSEGTHDIIIAPQVNNSGFGLPSDMQLLLNDGNEILRQRIIKPAFKNVGMISDLQSCDLNGDGKDEILFSQYIGHIEIISKNRDSFERKRLSEKVGFWNKIYPFDFNGDEKDDILALNIGLNNRLNNIGDGSIYLFVNDFDRNGQVDNVYCYKKEGLYYPIHLREEMVMQMPLIKKNFLKYKDYASASLSELFGEEIITNSITTEINEFRSGIFINDGKDFIFQPLPSEVQNSEMKAAWIGDLNSDNRLDIIIGGNQYEAQPHIGINAASFGHVLLNNGSNFEVISKEKSGFFEKGEIREIIDLKIGNKKYICVFKCNNEPSFYLMKN